MLQRLLLVNENDTKHDVGCLFQVRRSGYRSLGQGFPPSVRKLCTSLEQRVSDQGRVLLTHGQCGKNPSESLQERIAVILSERRRVGMTGGFDGN